MLDQVVSNAVEFMTRAAADLPKNPKFSLINFYAAIELFLKARLLAEHWSLVVQNVSKADKQSFEKGDFQSVTLREAITRLGSIVQQPLCAYDAGTLYPWEISEY